ncbi:MAG: YdcF family protein [Solirubrobacteraceae bacterium]
MEEDAPFLAAEQFLTWFVEHGAAGWRDGALDVSSVSSLSRIRQEMIDAESDVLDENGLLDAIERSIQAAIEDLRAPNAQAALEQFGFTKASKDKGRVEREEFAANKLGRKTARWLRTPNRRYENRKPRDWLIRQVATSLMAPGKPMVTLDTEPEGSVVPSSAVSLLRLAALAPSQQKAFYDEFLKQAPRFEVPRYLAAPRSIQEALQQKLPIDTGPLRDLLDVCGIRHTLTAPPVTNTAYGKLAGRDARWAPVIRRSFQDNPTDAHVGALQSLYDYLSCQDQAPSTAQTRQLDVVIVAGARRAMNYRLDELLRILSQVSPTVILAGLAPLDGTSTVPVSEADAMLYYLREERHFDTDQLDLVLDHRATDTTESLQHALRPIREKAHQLGRAAHIGLITGPYHMRRMYYIAQRHWSPYAHAIGSIQPLPSGSSIDLRVLLDRSPASLERRNYGFRVFIQEYLKLIGGRVVAEF